MTGMRITYSPKVFIPLTQLCRDACGYCTFAQAPAHLPSPYLAHENWERSRRIEPEAFVLIAARALSKV